MAWSPGINLTMKTEAITHIAQCLSSERDTKITHAVLLIDSVSLQQRADSGMGCPGWHAALHSLQLQRLQSIYCPGYARVMVNEQADRLEKTADITTSIQLGKAKH